MKKIHELAVDILDFMSGYDPWSLGDAVSDLGSIEDVLEQTKCDILEDRWRIVGFLTEALDALDDNVSEQIRCRILIARVKEAAV